MKTLCYFLWNGASWLYFLMSFQTIVFMVTWYSFNCSLNFTLRFAFCTEPTIGLQSWEILTRIGLTLAQLFFGLSDWVALKICPSGSKVWKLTGFKWKNIKPFIFQMNFSFHWFHAASAPPSTLFAIRCRVSEKPVGTAWGYLCQIYFENCR
jgi:hypothetical protein